MRPLPPGGMLVDDGLTRPIAGPIWPGGPGDGPAPAPPELDPGAAGRRGADPQEERRLLRGDGSCRARREARKEPS